MDSSTRAHIERELRDLERLLTEYEGLLRDLPDQDPGLERRTALALVLQSFYQGAEAIFQRIAKRIDGQMPSSSDWHRQLLRQMEQANDRRPLVISVALAERLDPYLGFRHVTRHNYPFFLNWERMRGLVQDMRPTLASFRDEIEAFISTMDSSTDDGSGSS